MAKVTKIPVVMQMEALECGAASLCMIMAYYGKWLPLEEVRSACGVSRDGASAKNIVLAARNYGFVAEGYRMEPEGLRDVRLPAIIHWNFNHFVVLSGFKKDKVILNDPARGVVEVSLAEFDQSFTGIVLTFATTAEFVAEGKPKSVWTFAQKRLQGTLPQFIFVVLTGILVAAVGLVVPLYSKIFIDDILSYKNPEWVTPFLAAMIITLVFSVVASAIEELHWLKIEGKFAIVANAEFLWHVFRLPMEFFSQRYAGDIAARQASNEQVAGLLLRQLAPVFMNVCLLVFCLLVMINYSLLLTLIGISTAFLNLWVVRYVAGKQMDFSRGAMRDAGKLAAVSVSGIEMIESIKASGAENGFFQRWAGYFAKQQNANTRITQFSLYAGAVPSILQQGTNIIVLMTGVYMILTGNFTIGILAAFQGFLTMFLSPVNQLASVGQSFITMRSAMERIDDVMNYPAERLLEQASDGKDVAVPVLLTGKLSGALEMKDVSFSYSKLSPPLIRDFSLSLRPGSSVALVGGSGSGKSTLAKLIAGLYPADAGEILFDGYSREQIDAYVFRASVAMVDQDITLFEDTVADNIRMWDRSIEDFAVIMAARDADIHETIVSRPGGYDYLLQEGGGNFSGGQRQRFEIARVLAQEPTIIILDEATSALDASTEAKVMQNIRNIGATCIVVAHRLSTIRDCDEIIVLEQGVIKERGTHQELYAQGGLYTELVSSE
jgi:NHLM bacteriocin system ABC transporter peptidase/ATP-binding protein